MDNYSIISLNPNNLNKFIESQNLDSSNIEIILTYNLPKILYSKLLQSYINKNNNKYKISFNSNSIITFENDNYIIKCYFTDSNKLRIINDSIQNHITLDIIQNINSKLNNDKIIIKKYKKFYNINDKNFKVLIVKPINDNLNSEIFLPNYQFNQIINFNNSINLISQNDNVYYLEYEYNFKSENITKNINTIIELISFNKKLIIENDVFIDNYKSIMKYNDDVLKTINPINISIEALLDKIDQSHCVFTKTDGERVHVLIYDGIICYLNSIREVYFVTKIKNRSYNIVFDAELYNNIIYIFNVLYDNSNESINDMSLVQKLNLANSFIKSNSLDSIMIVKTPIFYDNNKEDFFKNIYNLILQNKNSDIKSDGIIFQTTLSLNKSREKKISDYKWKPIDETSIDFLVLIDDTYIKNEDGNYFKLNLYGFTNTDNGNEIIKYFTSTLVHIHPDANNVASMYPTTLDGDIIYNNMVVEFNPDFDDLGNIIWLPYRVRYDKSLAVYYFKRKQGNSIETCKSTIEYINMPISEDDFESLSINYEAGYEYLADKNKNKKVVTKRDPIIDRIFDFVKTNIITTFARWSVLYNMFSKVNMIDISCGNGTDLLKFYEYGVLMKKNNFIYHGYNENRIQINSTFNGAISRYNKFSSDKTFSNFPICSFYIYNIYQIFDNVNTKYNHFVCFDMYKYQDSRQKIYTINKIINKLLIKDSILFFTLAKKSISYESIESIVRINIDECIKIFSSSCSVLEAYTYDDHIQVLSSYRSTLVEMTNKKTADFLIKTLNAYSKLQNNILSDLVFFILIKFK